MSDTPRTDAVRKANIGHPLRMTRMIYHAEKLELELNQWKACAEALYNCATNDLPCDSWTVAYMVFEKLKGTK